MIYKRCEHKGKERDRCDDPWYASYKIPRYPRARVALAKWTGREIRTKGEALKGFDDLKTELRAGRYTSDGLNISRPENGTEARTFAWLLGMYETNYVQAKRLRTKDAFGYRTKVLIAEFGNDQLASITSNRIEDLQARLRARASAEGKSVPWINRPISLLRAIMSWGVKRKYITERPDFVLDKEDYTRWRRVDMEEEGRLLQHAAPLLKALMIVGLDTGMRRGEMLALRCVDVDLDKNVIRLRGTTTKDAETRDIPILTARLRGVLAWLKQNRPPMAPLVTTASGEPLSDFRYHWARCRLLAYGFQPRYNMKQGAGLSPECKQQLEQIDLHWHDLRHEFACRLDDRGTALGKIQRLLGHASIQTTERYLRRGLKDLQTVMLDDGTLPAVDLSTPTVLKVGLPPSIILPPLGANRGDRPQQETAAKVSQSVSGGLARSL